MVAEFWSEAAQSCGVVFLDNGNPEIGGIAIVSGYGHFDLGHAVPGLRVSGVPVTERIYLSGGMGRIH